MSENEAAGYTLKNNLAQNGFVRPENNGGLRQLRVWSRVDPPERDPSLTEAVKRKLLSHGRENLQELVEEFLLK